MTNLAPTTERLINNLESADIKVDGLKKISGIIRLYYASSTFFNLKSYNKRRIINFLKLNKLPDDVLYRLLIAVYRG